MCLKGRTDNTVKYSFKIKRTQPETSADVFLSELNDTAVETDGPCDDTHQAVVGFI